MECCWCWALTFAAVFTIFLGKDHFADAGSSANSGDYLTCREQYISVLGRYCSAYTQKKRDISPASLSESIAEEETDYSDIIGLAISHAEANAKRPEIDAQLYSDFKFLLNSGGQDDPEEQHTMFFKENFPIFQQPRINPLSEYLNSYNGGQQPRLGQFPEQFNRFQGQQPQPQPQYRQMASPPPSQHPRRRRMYSTSSQLVNKCCGKPQSCYAAELAALSPTYYTNLCG